jgi:hypothetical protein
VVVLGSAVLVRNSVVREREDTLVAVGGLASLLIILVLLREGLALRASELLLLAAVVLLLLGPAALPIVEASFAVEELLLARDALARAAPLLLLL